MAKAAEMETKLKEALHVEAAGDTSGGIPKLEAPLHDLAGLSCADHGGPSNDLAAEMVYWSDIPSDADFKSPSDIPSCGVSSARCAGHLP